MGRGVGSKWETVTVPTKCDLGTLRKALEQYPDSAFIQFSGDPALAESMTRIPICVHQGSDKFLVFKKENKNGS